MIEFSMNRGILAALLCALFIGILLMLKTGRDTDSEPGFSASSFLEDIRILQKKRGVDTWILTAERADFFGGEERAELRSVGLTIPESALSLHAESGWYDFSANTFTALTPVEARGENYRIMADTLDFDISAGDIQTEGKVRLEGKGFSLEGEGMRAGKEQKVRILRDVKAIFEK